MRNFPLALLLAPLVGLACSKGSSPGAPTPPAPAPTQQKFDHDWAELTHNGITTFYIEDDRGEGLMGNVLRAQSGALAMAPDLQASLRQPGGQPLPVLPNPDDVQKVIKQNLSGVKSCYLRITRDGDPRSGKAIVSFQINAAGKVEELRVDAPAFSGTTLPSCVTGQIAHWVFPASQKGGLAISYPFVFVGG
jgi:hypothetical protein